MELLHPTSHRRAFRWPVEAREVLKVYVGAEVLTSADHPALKSLITRLAEVSGNPRDACWRFARQAAGVRAKQTYRSWTRGEQQKLLDLIATHSLHEVTLLLRRSAASVRSMLRRLGATAKMGQDWFTKCTLAEALHVRAEEVQKWIDRGWLKCRTVQTGRLQREIIDADDFCEFCKQHRLEIVGRRLNSERLNFVQMFVFPPSHMELLPVRESKKERAAYEEQMKKEANFRAEDEEDDEGGNWRATA